MVTRPSWAARILDKQRLAGDIWQFQVEPGEARLLDGPDFSFEAGQFISLQFEQHDVLVRRSYSLANAPSAYAASGLLELVVHCLPDGLASQYLLQASEDTPLEFSGPFGQLLLPEQRPERLLLIASGSGLAPYRSMLPQLLVWQRQGTQVQVLMGARSPDALFYQHDFVPLVAAGGDFIPCYSRLDEAPPGARLGYVQQQLGDLGLDPDTDLIYLCGAPPMIDACWDTLMAMGFGVRQVKREKYTYSSR